MPDKLGAILKTLSSKTGTKLSAERFDGRLRIQKAVYLLGALGCADAKGYSFSRYVHGPYSPDLARDYYRLMKQGPKAPPSRDARIPPAQLEAVAYALQRGTPFLEAAATLHMVWKHSRDSTLAKETVATMKPHLTPTALEEAWEFLRQHSLVDPTSTQAS